MKTIKTSKKIKAQHNCNSGTDINAESLYFMKDPITIKAKNLFPFYRTTSKK